MKILFIDIFYILLLNTHEKFSRTLKDLKTIDKLFHKSVAAKETQWTLFGNVGNW